MPDFEWPWQYSFPPFFTLQPNLDTRSKQLEAWTALVLDYCKYHKVYTLDVNEIQTSPLFTNKTISRRLPSDAILKVLEELQKKGNIEWTDKTRRRCLVMWRTPEEWGKIIYKWAIDKGHKNSVCTLFEITNGDDTSSEACKSKLSCSIHIKLKGLTDTWRDSVLTVDITNVVEDFLDFLHILLHCMQIYASDGYLLGNILSIYKLIVELDLWWQRVKEFVLSLRDRIMVEEKFVHFEEAIRMLKEELNYPEEKALQFIKRFDRNNDGKLSNSELSLFKSKIAETKVQLVPKFKEFDTDDDGYISVDEASTILEHPPYNFPPGKVVALLKRFDKDSNGKLDIEEFAGFYAEAKAANEEISNCFEKLDKDGNGVLSPDEVSSLIQEKMGFDENMAKYLVQMFDQNQDGSLDKTEFIHLWESMFGSG